MASALPQPIMAETLCVEADFSLIPEHAFATAYPVEMDDSEAPQPSRIPLGSAAHEDHDDLSLEHLVLDAHLARPLPCSSLVTDQGRENQRNHKQQKHQKPDSHHRHHQKQPHTPEEQAPPEATGALPQAPVTCQPGNKITWGELRQHLGLTGKEEEPFELKVPKPWRFKSKPHALRSDYTNPSCNSHCDPLEQVKRRSHSECYDLSRGLNDSWFSYSGPIVEDRSHTLAGARQKMAEDVRSKAGATYLRGIAPPREPPPEYVPASSIPPPRPPDRVAGSR